MGLIRFSKLLGGGVMPEGEPRKDETEVLKNIGYWLAELPNEEAQLRAIAYWMWRLKSGDQPQMISWIESVAEESAETVGARTGFKRAGKE